MLYLQLIEFVFDLLSSFIELRFACCMAAGFSPEKRCKKMKILNGKSF